MKLKIKRLPAVLAILLSSALATANPTVYIPLGSGNKVIAVDGADDRITATFIGVKNPHGLVATPDGEYVIAGSLSETEAVVGQDPETPNSQLALIHPAHGHVMLTIDVVGWTHHQAITPDGRYVISTHPTRGRVSIADLQSNQIVATVDTGPGPNYTVISADGSRAYVTNSGNGSISEISVGDWKVLRTLAGGPGPEHLVLSADGKTLYASNPRAGTVSAINIGSGKVTGTWPVGKNVHGLDISDDGKRLFVTAKQGNRLVAVATDTGEELKAISLSPAPYHLNTIHGTNKIYVSSRVEPKIWVVDQNSLEVLSEIVLPAGEGHQMAIVQ